MFDYQTIKLMHRHGEDDYVPMSEAEHDPAAHDPERSWLRGAKLFKCTRCEEEVLLNAAPGSDDPRGEGQ